MYHDFSSKQSVNSTSFYLHFCMRLFEKKKTTWKCVSVFSSRTRIPMKWCECMFLVEMPSNVERYGWSTTFLPFNFKRAFENAIIFLGYIFFTHLMKNAQVGKIISVTFNNLCIVPHLTILENNKNKNSPIHGLEIRFLSLWNFSLWN